MQSPRQICLELLVSTEKGQEYSNIALDRSLRKYPALRDIDRRFISALYYGVLERRITLDFIIENYSSRPAEKLSTVIRQILRMGLYQILYMDSVPESAAVNESVILAGSLKNQGAAGYINALLRNFIRSGSKIPKTGVKLKDLSIEYSCPVWIISSFIRDFGGDAAVRILETSLLRAPMTARLNTYKYGKDEIISALADENVSVKLSDFTDSCAELFGCGSVESLESYKKGMFHIQDLSCQICCHELGAEPGMTVLDMCAAPGGKTFTLAEMMGGSGKILAFDLHENRVRLTASGAKRLGLSNVTCAVNNAKVYNPQIPPADRILCDVPCSGLGVIRRKPEIKYRSKEELSALPKTQFDILTTSSKYLKPGGVMIYSTCTLRNEENIEPVERFLKENPDFEPVKLSDFTDWHTTITPDLYNSDGFFIAKIARKRGA